jgi:nitric oxide reductase NorD protein
MEEKVGELWHRMVTRLARTGHPEAAVELPAVQRTAGVLFRACGGDGGLRVEAANPFGHSGRRSWLKRLAGTDGQVELATRDEQALRLPPRIQLFADAGLNRDLFLWLAALAAQGSPSAYDWFVANQRMSRAVLERYPGMATRYARLLEAYLTTRIPPERLPPDEAAQEQALRAALQAPGTVDALPPARRRLQPVHLWLQPAPPVQVDHGSVEVQDQEGEGEGQVQDSGDERRRRAARVDSPERNRGLLGLRFDAIFGWAEYAKVDRGTEDNDDMDEAMREANDMELMSVSRDSRSLASRVRFDLDLPAASCDDLPIGPGLPLPEWDYRRQQLIVDACLAQDLVAADAAPRPLPEELRRMARRLRGQFQALVAARTWERGQPQGEELDLDAYLRYVTDRAAGHTPVRQDWYRSFQAHERDLSCLLLADLSLSTDTWVNNQARVVDVIRDSLFLFSEAMSATGDRFALWGFSSRKRADVRMHCLKGFDEHYNDVIRGRIAVIKPGFYTRMGAAVRHATRQLERETAGRRLLLLLTDGKPNDLDQYEGRYGIEDTRMALREARRAGLHPFCVTIDDRAGDYLPWLFGNDGFVVIRRPAELPQRLPMLYAQLSRS